METLRPRDALGLYGVTLILLIGVGPLLSALGMAGIAFAQIALIAGPAVVATLKLGDRKLARLGVRAPLPAALAGAVLVGVSFWYVNLWLVVPIADRYMADPEEVKYLGELMLGDRHSLWARLIAIAVAPAVCEEILLRGAVARALRPVVGVAGAIAISALLFALLHLSPTRLLPTLAFGVVLGYVALATRSVVPAMIVHLLNNAMIILLGHPELELLRRAGDAHPHSLGAIACVATLAGVVLIRQSGIPNDSAPSS